MESTAKVIDIVEEKPSIYAEETENDKELKAFIIEHTDNWREYRDHNFMSDWDKYERNWRGIWSAEDKTRESERSRLISPATQQAIETRHAEIMEAIFGQGEFFDIKDDLLDENGTKLDVEKLKNQLEEDFAQDKIRKAIDQIALLAEVYGTGIGEIVIGDEKIYTPAMKTIAPMQVQYGVQEKERTCVKLVPVNPKNFLFDPNGTCIDDCMGNAIERNISIHKIAEGIASGKYRDVDISSFYKDDSLEPTQEATSYKLEKVTLLTYYGLVPKEYLSTKDDDNVVRLFDDELEDYSDMVEAIVVIANGDILLKVEESPYMMKDRPIVSYQADTVPNRLLGRGTAEKAYNMQAAMDGSMRSHMDALVLTTAPMVAIDATRLPRGAKFEVKPGKSFLVNGNPAEILMPFKFGTNDGQSMETSKEFERLLLMATATIDSNGQVSQVARDSNMDMATATMIKKYKRVLVNIQEDFIIPFVQKAAWRYMQFDPKRYPSVDAKFIPTASLGIIAREYEQKQLAFLIQTLGADSKLTPILMEGILSNSSLSSRESMIEQMRQSNQPDPQAQQMAMQSQQAQLGVVTAQAEELNAKATEHRANAQKTMVEAQLAPEETKAKIMNAISTNLPKEGDDAEAEFNRRVKISELMLKEEDIKSTNTTVQTQAEDAAHARSLKERELALKEREMEIKKAESEHKRKPKKLNIKAPSGETYSVDTND